MAFLSIYTIFDLRSKIGCISEIQRKKSFPLVFRSICTIFATEKAAIKREKTRKDFGIFRAEAVSNEVQKRKTTTIMEITTRTFTDEEWTEHEQFVQMFRAAKQRKQDVSKSGRKRWEWCWPRRLKRFASAALRLTNCLKRNKR